MHQFMADDAGRAVFIIIEDPGAKLDVIEWGDTRRHTWSIPAAYAKVRTYCWFTGKCPTGRREDGCVLPDEEIIVVG